MVGVVLVSHSAGLAAGLKDLLDQLVQGGVRIVAAGGAAGSLGTDATLVAEAIRQAGADGDGTAVLVDLGSAVLSAETALELLPEGWAKQVALCDAPLVEGAVAAALEASLDADLAAVRTAAEAAWEQRKLAGG